MLIMPSLAQMSAWDALHPTSGARLGGAKAKASRPTCFDLEAHFTWSNCLDECH